MEYHPPTPNKEENDALQYEPSLNHIIIAFIVVACIGYLKNRFESRLKTTTPIETDYQIQTPTSDHLEIDNLIWQANMRNQK